MFLITFAAKFSRIMKKYLFLAIMAVSTAMLISCTSDDPFEDYNTNGNNTFGPGNNGPNNNSNTPSGNGSSAITGELTTFDIALDKTTAEPTDVADAYFPDEEDILENNEFTTEIAIDLSNPVAKTENGVEITVNGGHITANHGDTKKLALTSFLEKSQSQRFSILL